MNTYYVIGALVLVILIAGTTLWWMSVNIDKFQRTATEGDWCAFFVDEDRLEGHIIIATSEYVVINSVLGQYERPRTEIYPL